AVAERVRHRFANLEIFSGQFQLRATVSSGLATAGQLQPDLEVLMSAADRALYRAKKLCRKRVELETVTPEANGARETEAVRWTQGDRRNPMPSCTVNDRCQPSMPQINTRFLFTIALEIQASTLGDTPYGHRRFFHFDGGSFDGPDLKGKVLPGGGGW